MLFNSPEFLAIFLPITILGYFFLAANRQLRLSWLLGASIVFYGMWDIRFLPLLCGSVVFNWWISRFIKPDNKHWLAVVGVGFNLLLIGVFKYVDFIGENIYSLLSQPYTYFDLILPLGISFFTFQQISYLVDRSRGHAQVYGFLDYALYVTFFPQLIAGPIVRHNEIINQYQAPPLRPEIFHQASAGLVLFCIGLFKKTVLADRLGQTATPLFNIVEQGGVLSMAEGWVASSSYSLQLYFDFSGYSDMAIGVALMLGLNLPINFDSPYRAISIRDFWRRWHITLSRFLRDYLYIPLGGNRFGFNRMMLALLLTMLLGGLWHGAGWTFLLWGLLHGIALVVNHYWANMNIRMPVILGWCLTILFLLFTWVLFRSDSLATSWSIWESMLGVNGIDLSTDNAPNRWFALPAFLIAVIGPCSHHLALKSLSPRRIYAVITAVLLFILSLNVASDGYTEFLYFQF